MQTQVIVLGGGPGGYACAIRCAQLGLQTVLIEEGIVGGVCLNRGCIPTKALFSATKLLARTQSASAFGLMYEPPEVELHTLRSWKEQVVRTLTGGVATLLKKNGVTTVHARGRLTGEGAISLSTGETITAERIVLATGSSPFEIPSFPFSHPAVWSSDDALALREIPARLAVIGGGVIGLELATIYRRLGSEVTVIELLPEVLSTVDLDRRTLSTLKRALKEQGIELRTGTAAKALADAPSAVQIAFESGEPLEVDRVLVAVGRRPNSGDIGLEAVGIEPDRRGFIPVDHRLATSCPNVYAIGDVVGGPMLAHKASADAVALAESFTGKPVKLDYDNIPQAIFTDPEIASIGLSEARAKEQGHELLVGRFPYAALGKALGMAETDGFFQVVADADDHKLLGVQIVGAEASDLISEAALALQAGITVDELADAVHPHPTLPEGLKEAAENALGKAIHTINR